MKTIYIMAFLSIVNVNAANSQCNPLEEHLPVLFDEYVRMLLVFPSCGLDGGAVGPHDRSSHCNSFWQKYFSLQDQYGGSLTCGYRCPVANYLLRNNDPPSVYNSCHQFGNAADTYHSNPNMYSIYRSEFIDGYPMSSTSFHVEDEIW